MASTTGRRGAGAPRLLGLAMGWGEEGDGAHCLCDNTCCQVIVESGEGVATGVCYDTYNSMESKGAWRTGG